jgi:hypothetical protein
MADFLRDFFADVQRADAILEAWSRGQTAQPLGLRPFVAWGLLLGACLVAGIIGYMLFAG